MSSIKPTLKHLTVFCAALLLCAASATQAEPDFLQAIALPDAELLGRFKT